MGLGIAFGLTCLVVLVLGFIAKRQQDLIKKLEAEVSFLENLGGEFFSIMQEGMSKEMITDIVQRRISVAQLDRAILENKIVQRAEEILRQKQEEALRQGLKTQPVVEEEPARFIAKDPIVTHSEPQPCMPHAKTDKSTLVNGIRISAPQKNPLPVEDNSIPKPIIPHAK